MFFVVLLSAIEEDGRPHQKVSDSQQRDLCHPQQVHEGCGDRQFYCGACSLFPASYTSVSGHHMLNKL